MRARLRPVLTLLPLALALVGPGLLLAHLLNPDNVLVERDVPFFHLPLRAELVDQARSGNWPEWNPRIHSGQPILSNPNYAAFYPPTWLALALPVHYSLSWLILLHVVLGGAGSWRLLRRLGCEPTVAATGALAMAGGPWFLGLTGTFNFFCGMAWFPWVLGWGLALLLEGRTRHAMAVAGGLALQLFAGEPAVVLITALALACFAVTTRPVAASLRSTLLAGCLAALVAAVQLVPTAHRLAQSPRRGGLAIEAAGVWSAPPIRFVEAAFPRFWGDHTEDEGGLYFGWGLHDRDYPYVVSLYAGLLPLVLLVTGICRWKLPFRVGWGLTAVIGLLLATGRHNPLYPLLNEAIPVLGWLRFPEKFVVLLPAMASLGGALALQHLLDRARAGKRSSADFGVALAGLVTAIAGGFTLVLHLLPQVGRDFVQSHSGSPLTEAGVEQGLDYLQSEAAVALALAIGVTLLLAAIRAGGLGLRWAPWLGLMIVALDVGYYGRGSAPTLPRERALTPPALMAPLLGHPEDRVFSNIGLDPKPAIYVRYGPVGFIQTLGRVDRLDPYVGNLWGLNYALNEDFDLMLTRWGRMALDRLHEVWPDGETTRRVAGAWSSRFLLIRRPIPDLRAELERTGRAPHSMAVGGNPSYLPRYRSPALVRSLPDREQAGEALAEIGYDVSRREVVIGSAPTSEPVRLAPVQVRATHRRPGFEHLELTAKGAGLVVIAETFDEGWSATLVTDGQPAPPPTVLPTALGQLAVPIPPGDHLLTLRYRDPWVGVGAAVSLTTLLAAALVGRRRQRGTARPPVVATAGRDESPGAEADERASATGPGDEPDRPPPPTP